MRAVAPSLAALFGVACASPLVHYAALVEERIAFGEIPSGSSATETAHVDNLTDAVAHVYFLPPTPFSAAMEDETGQEYVPIDLDEHIPIDPGARAEIALTYTCEPGETGAFASSVFVVAGDDDGGPWTATQEVGELRFEGTCAGG
ncbi:hypothetical protein L6R50_09525 [Myxococcota bacterium]|nr:hypothetical protein [Myxococcota bacterium]